MPGGNENRQVTRVKATGSVNDEPDSKDAEVTQATKTALGAMVDGMRPLVKDQVQESDSSDDDDDDDDEKKKKRKKKTGKKTTKKVKTEEPKEKTPEEKLKEEAELKAANANNIFTVIETYFETVWVSCVLLWEAKEERKEVNKIIRSLGTSALSVILPLKP